MLFILLALHLTGAHAQEIHQFDDKTFHIQGGFDFPGYELDFKGAQNDVKFTPNLTTLASVGVSWKDYVGVGWGFRLSESQEDKTNKGDSSYGDYRVSLAFNQFHLGLDYSKFKGFYVQDSGPLIAGWNSNQPYYQAPDFTAETAQVNLTWIFSPENFSLEATLDQTVRQEATGGSWLAGIAANHTRFSDPSEIIPTLVQSGFGGQKKLTDGQFDSLNLKGGYGFTYVVAKKYFATTALQIGLGAQQMRLTGSDFSTSIWRSSSKVDAVIAFGYNGDEYYSGLTANVDGTIFQTGDMQITSTLYLVKLFFGFRI